MKVTRVILQAVVAAAFFIAGAIVNGETIEETVKIVEEWSASNKAACSAYTIKTYINVIQTSTGIGNISPATIATQMNVLNAAYQSMGFTFTYLPSEIVTVSNDAYYNNGGGPLQEVQPAITPETDMKNSYHRGGLHNLNIYFHNSIATVSTTSLRGWGTPPFIVPPATTPIAVNLDGVVVLSTSVPGGSLTNYNAGDSLVNLVGIWLGLLPTYTDTQVGPPCAGSGDGVDDTPKQLTASNDNCVIGADSCPADAGVDPINNYMDDSTDTCRTTFTAAQKTRAQALFDQYRIPSCGPTACCVPVTPPVAPVAPPPVPTAPVTPPVAPTPAPGPGFCFSGANSVVVQGKGIVSMESVQIGDLVKTNAFSDKFSRVFSLAHIDREQEVEYLQIYTDDSGMPLEVTHNHFLHISNVKVVRAQDIKVGDMLGEQEVTTIETVTRRGLYNPLTESGDILVSGVRVSCFPSMLDVNPTMQAYLMHASLSMHRLACSLDFSICKNESYTEDGISTYLTGMMKHLTKFMGSHILVQLLLVFACAPFFLGSLALEKLIQSPGLVATMIGAFILHRVFYAKNTLKAKSM